MRSSRVRAVGTLALASAVAAGAAILVGTSRTRRDVEALTGALLADARRDSDRVFTAGDLEGLPDPVARYLETVITEGRPYVSRVTLRQRGGFRLGDADSPWKPLSATQRYTVSPPGFVWDARVEVAPFLPVRVVDAYEGGEGLLRAKLLSAIPVASSTPSPELNAGELSRYLAEAVWFPTALLPGEGVEWEPRDDSSARATLTHRGTTVSLAFHFDDRNLVERVVSEDRYREVDGAFEPTRWTGRFRNYADRGGMRIPLDGEAAWNLPDGDLPYWRGSVERVEYRPAE
ncbi:MAG: DUF6544 family protein [Haloferacaceae archaeon]